MEKKVLKNYIKKGKLFGVVSSETTHRKSYISWYIIKSNDLFYVGSTNSTVIGMSRVLDCYLKLLDKFKKNAVNVLQKWNKWVIMIS